MTTDITEVRKRLVKRSERMYDQSRPYVSQLVVPADAPMPTLQRAILDATEGLIAGNVFAFTLAAVLRVVAESDHPAAPILAERMARMASEAMNSGLDWLEGANDDLDGTEDAAPVEQIPGQLAIAGTESTR